MERWRDGRRDKRRDGRGGASRGEQTHREVVTKPMKWEGNRVRGKETDRQTDRQTDRHGGDGEETINKGAIKERQTEDKRDSKRETVCVIEGGRGRVR